MEMLINGVVVDSSHTSYKNRKIIFKYFFGGRSGLLLFDAREFFEEEHTKYFDMMDIKKVHISLSVFNLASSMCIITKLYVLQTNSVINTFLGSITYFYVLII